MNSITNKKNTDFSWKVYWKEHMSDMNLFGAYVFYHAKDDVEYRCDLMSPGTVIKEWHSKTNFQSSAIEPSLPMIDGERQYRISLSASKNTDNRLIMRLVFFDRYDYEICDYIVRDKEGIFKCPLNTFSYDIQLINSGIQSFHFYYITISEIEDEQ